MHALTRKSAFRESLRRPVGKTCFPAARPPKLPGQACERLHKYDSCAHRIAPIARDLRNSADPAALTDWNLYDTQPGGRDAHLHLQVPAESCLAHAQVLEHVSADRPER